MHTNPWKRGVLILGALAIGTLGLIGLPVDGRRPQTSSAGTGAVAYSTYQEAAILSAMAQGADFGPGFVESTPGGSSSILRGVPLDLTVGELFLTIQNFGDCSLQLVHHSAAGGSAQLGIINPMSSGSIALRLQPSDLLQVISMTDGTSSRFAWAGRSRDPL
jgi:hypothetical protein